MILKIVNTLLILAAVFMGIKQGWAMFSGKPEMLEMFGKCVKARVTRAMRKAIRDAVR